ncbi:MAG: hypothetical protein O3C21_13515 [Verrucomicrobia bacterium]|nr:hypothetical protein [Verrucomicrobiota bacterium]
MRSTTVGSAAGVAVVIGLGVWGYSKVKDNIATDPAKVIAMSNEMVLLDFGPDSNWKPAFAMDLFIMKMAVYAIENESAFLVVMDGDPKTLGTGEAFESQMRAEISKQNAQRSREQMEATKEISSSREDFNVKGAPTSFLVSYSEGIETGTRYIEISGSLESNQSGRTAFIYIKAPESALSLEDAKALIESAQ